jgi:CDP-glucose 4,6-dehydratase
MQSMQGSGMQGFWRGRRVFLTGHTGFKGGWMSLWLTTLGAKVTGYALAPAGGRNLWSTLTDDAKIGLIERSTLADIRDRATLQRELASADPQVVIHMAAQALVRESYRDPVGTFDTNVLGTARLLEACRALERLECVVVITSDKVYENAGDGGAFAEGDRLGGHDPYSSSKACAELVSASFRDSFFPGGAVPVATARAGNVIGGGDWSDDRLIPDCVRALDRGESVMLRYPEAVRPWQHVLEPLSGYLELARALVSAPDTAPRAVNFGPEAASFCTVSQVVEAFAARFDGKPAWQREPAQQPVEARALTLSSALARDTLGWRPRLDIRESLAWTADWYRAHSAGENMRAFSQRQIERYGELMKRAS